MATDSDAVATVLTETLQFLFGAAPSVWLKRESGVLAAVTGVPLVLFNGIWAESVNPRRAEVVELLDKISASGLPYCAQLRPGTPAMITQQAVTRGMELYRSLPLMALDDPAQLNPPPKIRGLVIRRLQPSEVALHTNMVADASEIDSGVFGKLITADLLGGEEVSCYIGEINGTPVTTGLGINLGENIGVFDIATPPAYRGRGYGTAVTARVVADGFGEGSSRAWLQSSHCGYGVYKNLGFRTVECWDCWIKLAWRNQKAS